MLACGPNQSIRAWICARNKCYRRTRETFGKKDLHRCTCTCTLPKCIKPSIGKGRRPIAFHATHCICSTLGTGLPSRKAPSEDPIPYYGVRKVVYSRCMDCRYCATSATCQLETRRRRYLSPHMQSDDRPPALGRPLARRNTPNAT